MEVAQCATNNLIACAGGECRGGELVHCVEAYAQHRARLVGAEYRVGRCDEPHLAPASALGHDRPRAPLVSRLPRVPGRGRLPGWSPPSFPAALDSMQVSTDALDTQELPAEPVRVDLPRPDGVVRLAPARPHVLLHLDHRHPFVPILASLGRGAFGCACHGSSNLPVRHRASTPHGTVSLFVCATIEPPDCGWRARRERRRVEVGRAGRASTKRP